MASSSICTKCRCCGHRRCMKKKLSIALVQSFVISKRSMTAGTVAKKKMYDDVETVKGFCYLGNRLMVVAVCCDGKNKN